MATSDKDREPASLLATIWISAVVGVLIGVVAVPSRTVYETVPGPPGPTVLAPPVPPIVRTVVVEREPTPHPTDCVAVRWLK